MFKHALAVIIATKRLRLVLIAAFPWIGFAGAFLLASYMGQDSSTQMSRQGGSDVFTATLSLQRPTGHQARMYFRIGVRRGKQAAC